MEMVGNAVSVPMAKWIAEQLTLSTTGFDIGETEDLPIEGSWPSAAWGVGGVRSRSRVSEWPVAVPNEHLSAFLKHKVMPLSNKATSGFLSRLVKSNLRYEEKFRTDLAHHAENIGNG